MLNIAFLWSAFNVVGVIVEARFGAVPVPASVGEMPSSRVGCLRRFGCSRIGAGIASMDPLPGRGVLSVSHHTGILLCFHNPQASFSFRLRLIAPISLLFLILT